MNRFSLHSASSPLIRTLFVGAVKCVSYTMRGSQHIDIMVCSPLCRISSSATLSSQPQPNHHIPLCKPDDLRTRNMSSKNSPVRTPTPSSPQTAAQSPSPGVTFGALPKPDRTSNTRTTPKPSTSRRKLFKYGVSKAPAHTTLDTFVPADKLRSRGTRRQSLVLGT